MSVRNQREAFPGREFHEPSGNVEWGTFLLWILVAVATSGAVGLAMFGLYLAHFFLVFIVPLFAAIVVGVMVKVAIAQGHCRSIVVGMLSAALCGVIAYSGYFYFGMIYHWGPRAAVRPDMLPRYIKARMRTDVLRDSNETWESAAKHSSTGMNWFTLVFDGSIIVLFPMLAGFQRPRKPYCESCGRWMTRRVTTFNPNQSAAMLAAFRNGSMDQLAAFCAQPVYTSVPNLSLGVDYCPSLQEGVSRGCAAYISLKHLAQAQPMGDPIDQAKGTLLFRCLQANLAELVAITARFKILEVTTGYAAPALRPKMESAIPPHLTAAIEIRTVEGEPAGMALSRGTLRKCTALGFIPLMLFFGGIVAAISGFELLAKLQELGYLLAGVGIVCFLAGAFWAARNPSLLGTRYMLKVLRQEIGQRARKIVDPGHPESLFVEVVPKANWGRIMLDTASDVGYLLFDRARREILFEGDRERYRIPVDALTYFGVEHYVHGQGAGALTYYFVVLRIDDGHGFWEAPVRQRTPGGPGHAERRKLETQRMYDAIQQMRTGGQAMGAASGGQFV